VKNVFKVMVAVSIVSLAFGCSDKAPKTAGAPSPAPAPAAQQASPAPAPAQGQAGQPAQMMESHPPIEKASADASAPKAGSIKKAESGTVAEIIGKRASLGGKPVTFRGKVMKFSPMIMGKNWIHVQDGSGDATSKSNDLTITTMDTAKVGDVVVVNGKVAVNKDFGAGYSYEIIIEDAKIKVE